MSVIKFLTRIADFITDAEALEKGAALHKRHGGIEFKVLKVEGKKITIGAIQRKNFAGNYLSQKELVDRTKKLFTRFLPDHTVIVHAIPFMPHPSQSVTPEWLQGRMKKEHLKVKDLVELTGLEKSNISAWVNGVREMSNIVKSMFYAYLNKQ